MKFLPLILLLAGFSFPSAPPPDDLDARFRRLTPLQMDEVLWLARCVYSESDRPHEQRLVAWVVRNRVETRYRGYTYREVVLETKQFSAFNAPSPRREHILSLYPDSPQAHWRRTLQIALDVYLADASDRPFSIATRHFYSPVSMVGRDKPTWADSGTALSSQELGVDANRFRFYADVDPDLAGTPASGLDAPEGQDSPVASRSEVRLSRRLSRPKLSGSVARPARPSVKRPGT